jgi:hypothetical protein
MARSHAHPPPSTGSQNSGSAPWIVFIVAMVLVLTAALSAVLINARQNDTDQSNPGLQLKLPSTPNFKMPSPPPAVPH